LIQYFTHLQHDNYQYNLPHTFPPKPLNLTNQPLTQLSTKHNPQNNPLIQPVQTDKDLKRMKLSQLTQLPKQPQ
ncbi:Rho termination protein, partial [Staphylococcus epidermidis]|uniref:Rho termination protein n=1 Tax=Staphylococcus epidermidis TaxID=1282 RepID=UPI001C931243